MEGLKEFLYAPIKNTYRHNEGDGSGSSSGYGSGYGNGYGNSDGSSSGYGYGYGYGNGSGDGYGSGYGYGNGNSNGSGDGYGYGCGYGSGDGDGDGSGNSSDVFSFNGKRVYYIDGLATIILAVRQNIARGFILYADLTTQNCYVAKVGYSFAHGESIKAALQGAEKKHLISLPLEERIDSFLTSLDLSKPIPAKDLFDWHFKLTGSCELGRDAFVKEKGIDLNKDSFTITEFISMTEGRYGGDTIKQLKLKYNEYA